MTTPHTIRTIYLAGPMTGLPDLGFPAFHAAAAQLRAEGFTVLNPAENFGGDVSRPRSEYLRLDIQHVCQSDAVYVLPGYEKSRGALLEMMVATALELPVIEYETGRDVVDGSRQFPPDS